MLGQLIASVGLWFLVAVALETAAVFVEQWGASRSPDDDGPKRSGLALLALVLTILTPGLLLLHAFVATEQTQDVRLIAMSAPVAAILVGALLGAIVGAAARGLAPTMRKLALPLDILAFAVTIFATLASLQAISGASF